MWCWDSRNGWTNQRLIAYPTIHNLNTQYCQYYRQKRLPISSAGTQQVQEQISSDITDGRITAGPQQGLSVWHSLAYVYVYLQWLRTRSAEQTSIRYKGEVCLCARCIVINKGIQYSVISAITKWKCKIGPNDSVWCKKLQTLNHFSLIQWWFWWSWVSSQPGLRVVNHIDWIHTLCGFSQILIVSLHNCTTHLQTLKDNNHLMIGTVSAFARELNFLYRNRSNFNK